MSRCAIDINPLARIFDIRLRVRYVLHTRYAHCVSADLYHIEIATGDYIEFAIRQIYRVGIADISTKRGLSLT